MCLFDFLRVEPLPCNLPPYPLTPDPALFPTATSGPPQYPGYYDPNYYAAYYQQQYPGYYQQQYPQHYQQQGGWQPAPPPGDPPPAASAAPAAPVTSAAPAAAETAQHPVSARHRHPSSHLFYGLADLLCSPQKSNPNPKPFPETLIACFSPQGAPPGNPPAPEHPQQQHMLPQSSYYPQDPQAQYNYNAWYQQQGELGKPTSSPLSHCPPVLSFFATLSSALCQPPCSSCSRDRGSERDAPGLEVQSPDGSAVHTGYQAAPYAQQQQQQQAATSQPPPWQQPAAAATQPPPWQQQQQQQQPQQQPRQPGVMRASYASVATASAPQQDYRAVPPPGAAGARPQQQALTVKPQMSKAVVMAARATTQVQEKPLSSPLLSSPSPSPSPLKLSGPSWLGHSTSTFCPPPPPPPPPPTCCFYLVLLPSFLLFSLPSVPQEGPEPPGKVPDPFLLGHVQAGSAPSTAAAAAPRPAAAAGPGKAKGGGSGTWPPQLRNYVERAFTRAKTAEERTATEVIDHAFSSHLLPCS